MAFDFARQRVREGWQMRRSESRAGGPDTYTSAQKTAHGGSKSRRTRRMAGVRDERDERTAEGCFLEFETLQRAVIRARKSGVEQRSRGGGGMLS